MPGGPKPGQGPHTVTQDGRDTYPGKSGISAESIPSILGTRRFSLEGLCRPSEPLGMPLPGGRNLGILPVASQSAHQSPKMRHGRGQLLQVVFFCPLSQMCRPSTFVLCCRWVRSSSMIHSHAQTFPGMDRVRKHSPPGGRPSTCSTSCQICHGSGDHRLNTTASPAPFSPTWS